MVSAFVQFGEAFLGFVDIHITHSSSADLLHSAALSDFTLDFISYSDEILTGNNKRRDYHYL